MTVKHPERIRRCNVPAFPIGSWEICLRRWSFMTRYAKKKNRKDIGDVINVQTRVAYAVQKPAKRRASAKNGEHGEGWGKH